MKLLDTEEMGRFVHNKIVNGWFILKTDIKTQGKFEEGFYPPGTSKNKDFEIVFVNHGKKVTNICIAKLTKDVQDYMKINDKEFNGIVLIKVEHERVGYVFNYIGTKNEKARSDFIYNYLNNLLELMETGKITREFVSTNSSKKKSRKQSKRKSITTSIRHEVFKRDGYKCLECNASKEDGGVLHVDHIIPVAQGGSDELDNLQTLCQDCNLAKSNRAWKGGEL